MKKLILFSIVLSVTSSTAFAGTIPVSCSANESDKAPIIIAVDGTLYHPDELSYPLISKTTVNYFVSTAKLLKASGVQLLLVPMPSRPSVRSSTQPKGYKNEQARKAYADFVTSLNQAGIPTVDLLTAADNTPGFFLKYDWHFSPVGAQATAKSTVNVMRSQPIFSQLHHQKYATESTEVAATGGSPADLLFNRCGGDYPTQPVQYYKTEAQDEAGLLDDIPPSEVVLVGSSFSEQKKWNFNGFLEQELQAEVTSQSIVAGGLHAAIINYLMSSEFVEHHPKFLVWEFPINSLTEDSESKSQWEQVLSTLQPSCAKPILLPTQKVEDGMRIILPTKLPMGKYDISATFSDKSVRYWIFSPNDDSKQNQLVFRNLYAPNSGQFKIGREFDTPITSITLWNLKDNKGQVTLQLCKR